MNLIKIAGGLPQSKSKNDDDAIDRLSHRYTCSILIIFSIVVSTKSYVGDPLHCWVPKHFSKPWTAYADSYCYVKGTHYVPMEPDVDLPKEDDIKDIIPYYQWIPLIMLTQVPQARRCWDARDSGGGSKVDGIQPPMGRDFHLERKTCKASLVDGAPVQNWTKNTFLGMGYFQGGGWFSLGPPLCFELALPSKITRRLTMQVNGTTERETKLEKVKAEGP